MTRLPIVLFPDPILRRPCLAVSPADASLRQLAADMLETMYAAPGRGLAAPQIGVARRLFVMDCGWKTGTPTPRVCLNPEILDAAPGLAINTEGCLSIPGVSAQVARPEWVVLRWQDLDGAVHEHRLEGFESVCAQHELDHLNGRLCIDLMTEDARGAASATLAAMGAR